MVFNATFINISDISWRSVLLVKENHRHAAGYVFIVLKVTILPFVDVHLAIVIRCPSLACNF
jgi:hypothetical protein